MEYEILQKILTEKKQLKYLRANSQWYKYLNRSPEYYESFLTEFKKKSREESNSKITSAIDSLSTVNTIFNIIN